MISVLAPEFYPLEELFYVEGSSLPSVAIEVRIGQAGAQTFTFETKADSSGSWAIAERAPLGGGDWEVRARAISSGIISDWSTPRVFTSVITGVRVAGSTFKYATLALVLAVFVALLICMFAYFTVRTQKLKRRLLMKETREARERVIEGFRAIRSDLIDELKTLESEAAAGSLDTQKLTQKERLLRELHTLEDSIARELEDVERVS